MSFSDEVKKTHRVVEKSRAQEFLECIPICADESLLTDLNHHLALLSLSKPISLLVEPVERLEDPDCMQVVEGRLHKEFGRFVFDIDRRHPPLSDQLHAKDKYTGFQGAYQMPSGKRSELTKYPGDTPRELRKEIEKRFKMKVESWSIDRVEDGMLLVRAILG